MNGESNGYHASPKRIAILECDPLTPAIREKRGSYGEVVTSFLHDGAARIGLDVSQLKLSIWNVQDYIEYPKLDDIDAAIITGSRFSAYDDIPWITALVGFIKSAMQHGDIRIIGLCFGHQVIARALGASGGVNSKGYEMSVCNVDLTPSGQKIFNKKSLTQITRKPLRRTQAIHQMHHDIIEDCPKGTTLLGSSPTCAVQGLYTPGKVITLQAHPEFDSEIMLQLLSSSDELGFEDRTLWEDAMSRAKMSHDGPVIAATFLEFLLGKYDE